MEIAAAANPDGHTIYLGQPVITLSPNFRKRLGFDPLKAFAPVSLIGTGPTLLAVHPSLPANSIKELIAYAKTRPQQDVRDRLTAQGVDVQSSSTAELAELIRADAIGWATLVKAARLVLE